MSKLLKKVLDMLIGVEPGAGVTLSTPSVSTTSEKKRPLKKLTERELIQLESEIGAHIFGEIPKGHRREFFNLDKSTWIWYDEWVESITGRRASMTVRYEVHPQGVLKVQEGARYDFISGQELENFMAAVELYYERVSRELYHTEPIPHSVPHTV